MDIERLKNQIDLLKNSFNEIYKILENHCLFEEKNKEEVIKKVSEDLLTIFLNSMSLLTKIVEKYECNNSIIYKTLEEHTSSILSIEGAIRTFLDDKDFLCDVEKNNENRIIRNMMFKYDISPSCETDEDIIREVINILRFKVKLTSEEKGCIMNILSKMKSNNENIDLVQLCEEYLK